METLAEYEIDLVAPLEYDSPAPGQSMATTPKKEGRDWKALIPAVISIIVLTGAIVWTVHYEISKLDDRIAGLDKHIARVEIAVRIVGAKQGGDTKTLIDEALTVAANASAEGRTESAKTVMGIANRLLAEQ